MWKKYFRKIIIVVIVIILMTFFKYTVNNKNNTNTTKISKNSIEPMSNKKEPAKTTISHRFKPNEIIKTPNGIDINVDLTENDITSYITESFINDFIVTLDTCLVGDNKLEFSDSTKIPSKALYMFFVYLKNTLYYRQEGICGDPGNAYLMTDEMYHIPLKEVIEVLNNSFVKVNLNPKDAYNYDESNEEFVTKIFSGFGGARHPKTKGIEKVNDTTVKITVNYYESTELKNIIARKEYVMDYYNGYWRYLSITNE